MHILAKLGIIAVIVIAVIVGGAVALFYAAVSEIENQIGMHIPIEELEDMRTDATYSELVNDNDRYIGTVVMETGRIISIEDISFGERAYLVDAGDGEYYMLYHPSVQYDDAGYVSFYGTVAGLDRVSVSGEDVRAVYLNGEDIIMSDSPFN